MWRTTKTTGRFPMHKELDNIFTISHLARTWKNLIISLGYPVEFDQTYENVLWLPQQATWVIVLSELSQNEMIKPPQSVQPFIGKDKPVFILVGKPNVLTFANEYGSGHVEEICNFGIYVPTGEIEILSEQDKLSLVPLLAIYPKVTTCSLAIALIIGTAKNFKTNHDILRENNRITKHAHMVGISSK
jgi:hypothetical protein